jgi:hypothetical protein
MYNILPNSRQMVILGIREREIGNPGKFSGIPEIISYSAFFIKFYLRVLNNNE